MPATFSEEYLDLKLAISDDNVFAFMEIIGENKPFLDAEQVRDILAISKLYDRNYDRMSKAKDMKDTKLYAHYKGIESMLNNINTNMKLAAGIGGVKKGRL